MTPQPGYKPTFIFWKPEARGDRFYATAHVKSRDGKARDVHLITSQDGLKWDMRSHPIAGFRAAATARIQALFVMVTTCL